MTKLKLILILFRDKNIL